MFYQFCSAPILLQLPGTLVFDYPSATAVVEFLTAQALKAAAAAAAAAVTTPADDSSYTSGELALASSPEAGLPLAPGGRAPCALAVVAVVARPLLAGGTADAIQRVPLERWDLDGAEQALGDPLALSAQARGERWRAAGLGWCLRPCGACCHAAGPRCHHPPTTSTLLPSHPTTAVWRLHGRRGSF